MVVHAGIHLFHSGKIAYGMPSDSRFRVRTAAEAGSFFDGYRTSLEVTPTWAAFKHLELRGAYSSNRIMDGRGQRLDAHVAQFRARVMFISRPSTSALVQLNSATNAVIENIRLRYNPREGNDLYVVYNHGIHTDRQRFEPFLPFTNERTTRCSASARS